MFSGRTIRFAAAAADGRPSCHRWHRRRHLLLLLLVEAINAHHFGDLLVIFRQLVHAVGGGGRGGHELRLK